MQTSSADERMRLERGQPPYADVGRGLSASGMDAVLLTRPGMVVRDGVEVQQ